MRDSIETDKEIYGFFGPYRFLSNFYVCDVHVFGVTWKSSEHAYQAAKTKEPDEVVAILKAETPGKAKTLGKSVTFRTDWMKLRDQLMFEIVRAKFAQNAEIRSLLFATGNKNLVEANDWGDTYWGCEEVTRYGKNHLGRILVFVRDELRDRIMFLEELKNES